MTSQSTRHFFLNLLYVFGSQVIVLISGLIKALIVPVLLGVNDYGYWQIYIFYTLYIGVFTFGYGDGLFLRYGGFRFRELPFIRIRFANLIYLAVLGISAVLVLIYSGIQENPNRQLVFLAVAGNILILGVTSNVSLTLQATNLLKGYAFLNSADKIFFCLALFALYWDGFKTYEYLIAVDVVSKVIVMTALLARYRTLFFGTFGKLSNGLAEFRESVSSGSQLLIANLSGMLVLGVGRIIVEYFGELDGYAYYAFGTQVASVVLLSITALSIVVYPTLKRLPKNRYSDYFNRTSQGYAVFSLLMLSGYFPAVAFIYYIATDYTPVLEFLNAMFMVTVLQGKMQLINNTYYKALRLERPMLVANLTSLVLATALSLIGFLLTESLLVIAYSTVATMFFRVYASEIFLRRQMNSAVGLAPVMEALILCVFLAFSLLTETLLAAGVWFAFILLAVSFQRARVVLLWRQIRGIG